MKRVFMLLSIILLIIIGFYIFAQSTEIKRNDMTVNDTSGIFDDTLNLRRIIDPASGKMYIDTFLEKIPDYPIRCNELNFVFSKKYAHFNLTRTRVCLDRNTVNVDGWYKLNSNRRKDDHDVSVGLYFYETKEEALEYMRNSLDDYAAPAVYQSHISIGDFAIGGAANITFVRGNVVVHVIGNFVVSEKLSRGIDEQILNIINGNITRENVERSLEKASDRVLYDLIYRRNEYIDFEVTDLDCKHYDERIVVIYRLKSNDRSSYNANVQIHFVKGIPQVKIISSDINDLEKIINRQLTGLLD